MALHIEHINKHIGQQPVLHDISFSLQRGEVLGLLGPNGAGKSTLMKILVGVWQADGNPTLNTPSSIGYLPELNPLYDDLYVREYLRFFMRLRNIPRSEQKNKVEELIARVGLTPEANKKAGELSKGYRQRLGLAQALIADPELLVLDEPTTGLDPNQLEDIRSLIRTLGKDRMIILSTHILQEVAAMCTRVLIIDHGRLRADLPMEQIGNVQALEQLFHDTTSNHE